MLARYRESKRSGLPMFPVKIVADLSDAQLWLLHWLQVYDWALTLPDKERPSSYVIDNDERFDAWLSTYTAHRLREQRTSGASQSASKHSKVINF